MTLNSLIGVLGTGGMETAVTVRKARFERAVIWREGPLIEADGFEKYGFHRLVQQPSPLEGLFQLCW
jgi:hypothetical protein